MLNERLHQVRQRIDAACRRLGRDPASMSLVAVTKGVSVDIIRDAVSLGLTDLGENRVQEARTKQIVLGSGFRAGWSCPDPRAQNPEPIRWHLIGHLQRNKAKDAVTMFDVIHSVDSEALIEDLERQAAKRVQGSGFRVGGVSAEPRAPNPEPLQVFLQVNVSGEATKFGCAPDEAPKLAETVRRCQYLHLSGLMTMAPYTEDPEEARPHFRALRELRDELQAFLCSSSLPHSLTSSLRLSMGMSHDFDVAIEEGADIIRVGTAIFGARNG